MQKTSSYFQLSPQLFWKIVLKLCTYFTEEDAYLPFDRKKIRAISNFEIRGFKAHAGWQIYIINSFSIILKQT